MACSLSHTDNEVEALVQKLIDEDNVRQNAILDLALHFENACTSKDDLRKAYEKCNVIPQESRALIDTFLKEGSDKDYELNLSMYEKAAKLEKQMDVKLAWLLEKYYYRSQTHIGLAHVLNHIPQYVNANGGTVSGCLGDIGNNLKKEKLDQVVAIVKSCSPNGYGDLTVTMKDLPGTIPGTIRYKVIGEDGYENDITIGVVMILANVLLFSPKLSMHYLNITRKNVVKVFRKDTVHESNSG
nr:hypothetical protein [Tanacetum cinerariifolium]